MAVGPFGSAASRSIWKDAILHAAVRDDGYLLNRLGYRSRGRAAIARVGLPGMNLSGPKRFAQSVGDRRKTQLGVRMRHPIPSAVGHRIVNEPGAKVKCIVGGIEKESNRATRQTSVARDIGSGVGGAYIDGNSVVAEDRIVRPVSTQVDFVGQIILFNVRKQPTVNAPGCVAGRSRIDAGARRNAARCRFVVVHRQAQLAQVVGALQAASCLASRLNRGQEQADKDPDDGDNYEQFDQSETACARSTQTRETHSGNHHFCDVGRVRPGPATHLRCRRGYGNPMDNKEAICRTTRR
jgi:hypothetical protein